MGLLGGGLASNPTAGAGFINTKSASFPAWPPDTNARCTLPSTAAFNPERTDAFSIHGWVKLSSGADPGIATFFGNYDPATVRGVLIRANNRSLQFYILGTGRIQIDVAEYFTGYLDTWIALGVSYDGSGGASGVTIYRNGSVVSGSVTQNDLTGTSVSSQPALIGDSYISGAITNWYGNIDEVAIYDAAISSGVFTSLYNGGRPGSPPTTNLTHWYRFGDDASDTASTIKDQVGGADCTGTDITLVSDVPS